MNFDVQTLLGAAATVASITSFTPQAWKIIKTRDTSSLSTGMYALTVTGFALWLAYGAVLGQWPIMITNAICLLLAAFILTMKLLPPKKKDAVAKAIDPAS
ncbi:SemiSWEET family sugar transporter [Roseococcus sp. YIM B11640]|uniref:SemiSWEET family sugar transporter n=1 Tax=Roseococcus sp. YIM B11640 TaxID=3133973 RepID=UPI003C7CAB2D